MTTGPIDTCKTPTPGGPVPMPYPNISMVAQAVKTATKTKFGGMPVVHKSTEIPMSSGDEPGSAGGGVVSNMFKGKTVYKKGSSKVKVEGKKCEYHTANTGMNGVNSNTVGLQTVPSQTKVVIGM